MIYDTLDAAILNAIKTVRGADSPFPIWDRAVQLEAGRLASSQKREVFRVVDGRLQSLRKRGVIRYWKKNENPPDGKTGWRMVR